MGNWGTSCITISPRSSGVWTKRTEVEDTLKVQNDGFNSAAVEIKFSLVFASGAKR